MTDAARKRQRYHLRLLLWLLLLALVLLYGWNRELRLASDWRSPTNVALVLVDASSEGLDPRAVALLQERVPALQEHLHREFRRYRSRGGLPFRIDLFGPVTPDVPAPRFEDTGLWELVAYNFRLWRFSRRCDELAGVDADAFQVRVYLRARAPRSREREIAEGASQQGGPIGLVDVELSESSVDFALFVAAHELFHTRGASDKYGPDGLATFPEGFADPRRRPLFPQENIEVMARGRPLDAYEEEAPHALEQLVVGPWTAAEIGWAQLVP